MVGPMKPTFAGRRRRVQAGHGVAGVVLMVCCWVWTADAEAGRGQDKVREIVLNDDGGWSWFEDERAIIVGDRLIVGSVACGRLEPARRGDVDVVGLDLRSGAGTRLALHRNLEADDHDSPAFLALPDGRVLAMYSRHGRDARIYWRITRREGTAIDWEREREFVPSPTSRVTYSNVHWSPREGARGRIYNFFRGLDNSFKPSWMFSDDLGETWSVGGILIDVEAAFRHRPYVKYASDGRGRIHLAFTEGHPRDFDNSLHHLVIDRESVRRSDGEVLRGLREGAVFPVEATRVFEGTPDRVAWIHDVAVDSGGRVRVAWSVQMDSAGLPSRQGGDDHRYFWAEWRGKGWQVEEIAYAGSRLYPGEDDYTGGISLHPDDPRAVVISTNVDPLSGNRLESGHHELFRGRRTGGRSGGTWAWEALTPGATEDHLRPILPKWKRGRTALLWLRGAYRAYTDYDLMVMGRIE